MKLIKEMTKSHINIAIAIFMLTLIFFSGLFFRDNPVLYNDSYAYLNYIQGTTEEMPANTPFIGGWIIDVLPASETMLQIILLFMMALSAFIFSSIGYLYNKEYGRIAGVLFFGAFLANTMFVKLETEIFAIPFLLITWYLLKKYSLLQNPSKLLNPYLLTSIITLFISGFIWKGSIYFLPLFLIISRYNLYYILGNGLVIFMFNEFIYKLAPIFFTGFSQFVRENLIIIGIANIGIISWGMFKKNRIKNLNVAFWIYFVIALLNLKLSFIFFWIVAMNCSSSFYKQSETTKLGTVLGVVLIIMALSISFVNATPSKDLNEMIGVYHSVNIEGYDKKVDWDYGYFYTYVTKQPNKYFGSFSKRINSFEKTIALTYENNILLEEYNCNTLEQKKDIILVKCDHKKNTIAN